MTRWQRYWFADGGRLAVAIVRIAIACAVLGCLSKLAMPTSTGDLPGATTLYRPVGIWMLLGHSAPPPTLVSLLWLLAWPATIAMLVGAATRASTAVSFVTGVALASLSFASSRTWSHQYNVVFLAQLAFLGARGGDALSIDALIRRLRGRPPLDVARAYQWSLRLVQLAVALMFAGAAFHKILHGHFTLRWALSDNLRHQLLVRYDLAGFQRPPVVDWLIDDVWRYRGAAVLNLISQVTPALACVFVRRPKLRALCGMFFVLETIGLGLVVDLWNIAWLWLIAVFIDWDALVAWIARRPRVVPPVPDGWRPARATRIFIVAFVIYDVVTAFVPGLDQWLNTYPFSGFPMFATIRASAPYDEHQAYDMPGDHFEVTADHPVEPYQQQWFDHTNRGLATLRDPEQLRVRMAAVLAQAQRRYPELGVHAIRLYLTIYESPAYPARARFEPHPIGIVGDYRDDGTFASLLGARVASTSGGTGAGTTIDLAPRHVDLAAVSFVMFRDDHPTAIDLPATRADAGTRFDLAALPDDSLVIVARVRGADGRELPWLVAGRNEQRW